MNPLFLLAAAPSLGATPDYHSPIVVTAALQPVAQADAPASSTIIEADQMEALNLPLTADVLRLVPGVAVATSGPAGSQTQIRIRGAEASHTLLFLDGIKFNDPAAANEARFEMLANDSLSRIEVVRGPQSALWGAEALGGVVAVESGDPRRADGLSAVAEYGSLDTSRGGVQAATQIGNLSASASGSWLKSSGIDAVGLDGERDGFRNVTAGAKAVYAVNDRLEVGAVGHWIDGRSEFDDYDPAIFRRGNTLHSTSNRIAAGRLWAQLHFGPSKDWTLSGGASLLDSANRNRLANMPINRTAGQRLIVDARLSRDFEVDGSRHSLIVAGEHQKEEFTARDQQYFGATDQDRSRTVDAAAVEWRADWSGLIATDVAVRHDEFSRFADATTVRASLMLRPVRNWSLHAAYGEGIAQPSFYDLYGFFPGSFVGNPGLLPEHSRSWEAGLSWTDAQTRVAVTGFTGTLEDEIVDIFDSATFLSTTANVSGRSRRRGVEFEARHRFAGRALVAISYTYLDADQQQVSGTSAVREARRPRHSATLLGSWTLGPAEIGATLAYVGQRSDVDFDSFPSRTVRLDDYVLGSLNFGWRLGDGASAFVRAENLFNDDYEDAFGYETAGRTIHAGIRLGLGT